MDHISPSMTDETEAGKITKGSCHCFYYFSLTESEECAAIGFHMEAVKKKSGRVAQF